MGDALLKRITFTLLLLVLAAIGDRHWFRIESAMAAVTSARVTEHQTQTTTAIFANTAGQATKKRTIQLGPQVRAQFESSAGLAKRARGVSGVTS